MISVSENAVAIGAEPSIIASKTNAVADSLSPVIVAERTAAALARGLSGDRAAWQLLIEQARATLSSHPLLCKVRDGEIAVSACYDWDAIDEANAACRILDNAAQFSPQNSSQESRSLGLLAALAFAALGNFPSAKAVVARTFPTLKPKNSREAWLMACAAPVLNSRIIVDSSSISANYFTCLQKFLLSGSVRDEELMRAAWHDCAYDNAGVDKIETDLAQGAMEHALQLSSARVLKQQDLPLKFIGRVLKDNLVILLPPQWRALQELHLARSGDNAIVALPPGTGKTLLGEVCVMSGLQAGAGWAVFLVPYVALGQQVARALQTHAPDGWRVRTWLGGSVRDKGFDPKKKREIVVATPESLDAALRRNPQWRDHLRVVVCDEAHGIGGDTRGVRLEGILTRLCASQKNGAAHRLVLLSAAVQRTKRLEAWIGARRKRVLRERWCPTARRVAIWTRDGNITWHTGQSSSRSVSANQSVGEGSTHDGEFGRAHLAWANRDLVPDDSWPAMQRGALGVQQNISRLVEHLHEHFGGPILCVCATKRGARQVATAIGAHLPTKLAGEHSTRAAQLIRDRYPFLSPLLGLLERGACWHHAGLPHDLREIIEAAIKAQEITTVAATTTLAEGVDFPFRWTILVDWLQWAEGGQRPMPPHLFANIAGRCGRAGEWTEGDTLVFDNPLGDLRYTGEEQRPRWLRHVCLSRALLEPHSALEKLFNGKNTQSPNHTLLRAALESQFWAWLVETISFAGSANAPSSASTCEAQIERWAREFSQSTYLAQRCDAKELNACLLHWLRAWTSDSTLLEQNGDGWQLSSLGRAIYQSDLAPSSALRLADALRWFGHDDSPSRFAAQVALRLGDLPEQNHLDWRKVASGQRHRFVLRAENCEPILAAWLQGESAAALFASLPNVHRSKRQISFAAWLEGQNFAEENPADEGWYNELDKWAEWIRAVPETWLPHLLRAASTLAPALEMESRAEVWKRWADWFEHGVDSDAAVRLANDFPNLTRRAVCEIVRVCDGTNISSSQWDSVLKNLGGASSLDGASLLRWMPLPELEMAA